MTYYPEWRPIDPTGRLWTPVGSPTWKRAVELARELGELDSQECGGCERASACVFWNPEESGCALADEAPGYWESQVDSLLHQTGDAQ
jgi:hypothetical protein